MDDDEKRQRFTAFASRRKRLLSEVVKSARASFSGGSRRSSRL